MQSEIDTWKEVAGHSRYQASEAGDIKRGEYVLKPYKASATPGYKQVNLDGARQYVHRLIYSTFEGAIPPGYHIHHKNSNPSDNRLENLQALTPWEHAQHTFYPEWVQTQTKLEIFDS